MIRFSHTIFYVKDVVQAVDFYEKAFGLKIKFIHESSMYAELETGNVILAFANEELGKMNLPDGFQPSSLNDLPQACEIVFSTDDPHAAFEKAEKAGAILISSPQMKPWGQEVAYVRDPFGILIEIAGPLTL
jgi:lactoylglutathione lyase